MANKRPTLELTWIEEGNPPRLQPRIRVELADDQQQAGSPLRCHEARLAVCDKPRCSCSNIQFQWSPATAAAPRARAFWFNFQDKSPVLTPELEKDPEAMRLAQIIAAELTEADQQRLREWFLAAKLALIHTTPASQIDIANLPDADDGKMIGFVEAFPCGLALYFTCNQELWAVDEQYCVQPGCTCKETVLSFLKVMDAAGQKATSIQDPPARRYNYHNQASKPAACGPAGSPSLDSLLAALKSAHADLDTQLELRHLIMQTLYARDYLARAQTRLESISANAPSAGRQKIGRNDLCPCGSGRKYKHCCLKTLPE
jgi:hypothetical protein